MSTQQVQYVSDDTIFVTGLPEDTTEAQLAEYFGQIGIIKFDKKNDCPKIWIYKDKATGKGKGEATITYDDPPTASSAILWFNGKEFKGSTLTIELAQRKTAPPTSWAGARGGRGGGAGFRSEGRGGGGSYDRGDRGSRDDRSRPGSGRPGDWPCPSCNNNNFAYRQECNRCRTPKPASAQGGVEGNTGSESHYNGDRNNERGGGGYRGGYNNSRGGGGGGGSGGGSRFNDYRDQGSRGRGDRSSYRDRDNGGGNDRGGRNDRERDRGDRDRGDRDRNRNRNDHAGGPSRNHMPGKDDRRSRPY